MNYKTRDGIRKVGRLLIGAGDEDLINAGTISRHEKNTRPVGFFEIYENDGNSKAISKSKCKKYRSYLREASNSETPKKIYILTKKVGIA